MLIVGRHSRYLTYADGNRVDVEDRVRVTQPFGPPKTATVVLVGAARNVNVVYAGWVYEWVNVDRLSLIEEG